MKKSKAELRKQILKSRNALLPEQRKVWDRQILNRLIQYDRENPCPVYLCYVNYKSEVSTKEFILWCLENGKMVFVPKVMEDEAEKTKRKDIDYSYKMPEMEFYQITAWDELKTGYQGILEPEVLPEKSFFEWKKTGNPHYRMILPGAVFDTNGNRIGYGGGFYDRWLAKWNCFGEKNPGEMEKIGLAYKMQIVNRIPAESFDRRVDRVITEDEEEEYESGITL